MLRGHRTPLLSATKKMALGFQRGAATCFAPIVRILNRCKRIHNESDLKALPPRFACRLCDPRTARSSAISAPHTCLFPNTAAWYVSQAQNTKHARPFSPSHAQRNVRFTTKTSTTSSSSSLSTTLHPVLLTDSSSRWGGDRSAAQGGASAAAAGGLPTGARASRPQEVCQEGRRGKTLTLTSVSCVFGAAAAGPALSLFLLSPDPQHRLKISGRGRRKDVLS